MNRENRYIFELYHYLLNLRDTMEFCLDREHTLGKYEARKQVLVKGIEPNYALGNFLANNGEKGEEIKKKLLTFIDDVYGEDCNVIVKTATGIRVDHTQHIKIFEYVVGLQETLRDIVAAYMKHASEQPEGLDKRINELMIYDEVVTRMVLNMLLFKDYEKSFIEFNKLMNESKGKPTPQSNFIVQNELAKISGFVRFSRQHARCKDNATLDILDEGIKLLDMTEGRRERGEKSFKDLFLEQNTKTSERIGAAEAKWKEIFESILNEVKNDTAKPAEEPQA